MRATDFLTNETDVMGNRQRSHSFAATERICATVAHELKNPVNNILLSTTVLKDMNLTEEQSSFVEMISRNTDRINQLLTELVDATHISRLEISPVNICKLLDEVLLMMNEQVSAAAIEIRRNYPGGEYLVNVDESRMKKALMQVVTNAVEAMDGATGLLELSIWNDENESVIEIKDNGAGITDDQQQQMFEPYFTTKRGRRGLGLNIAQAIILSHGGSFTVHSDPPDGTTIVLRFRSMNLQ
ncbi:HAMP domain-containing sensor histidine kinase [Lacibacter sp. H375]|uniref:sensor histidine kinase n=1 Tax=Lacibacter sp. H375 TaxID=3133424 RepID=UPI0030BF0430